MTSSTATGRAQDGSEPDYRFTLANERTFLAWTRTALALTAGGLAVVQLLPEAAVDAVRYGFGAGLTGVGGAIPLIALRRWRRVQAAMRRDADLPDTRLPQLLAIVLLAGAAAVLGLIMMPASS
ncbi:MULTISPECIES: YidH family protein [Prauserella salsuginis group]|uniref:YidH family protein n=2 Tax=Prauserella salsuginis group TaxID=2893672 RepID=A0ABW6G1D6_9PSEU|nr:MULTISPECIES: DUF202 domain-containing protein [Prauserella salsuginis group]MBB3664689.1 putative membrane protein [Prauserella sediminis]MCR3722155.1 putative membrane protein [Prauserella flava]MCR3736153.1 putative membrane protein [Prauserella salsuginis]